MKWTATEVLGTEVSELDYQAMNWPHPRRLVLLRHRVSDDEESGDKRLLDVPGYRFQALVTSLRTPEMEWNQAEPIWNAPSPRHTLRVQTRARSPNSSH